MCDEKTDPAMELYPMTADDCKKLRRRIGQIIVDIKDFDGGSRERSLAITKLQEARHWLGEELGNLGETDLNAERDQVTHPGPTGKEDTAGPIGPGFTTPGAPAEPGPLGG